MKKVSSASVCPYPMSCIYNIMTTIPIVLSQSNTLHSTCTQNSHHGLQDLLTVTQKCRLNYHLTVFSLLEACSNRAG